MDVSLTTQVPLPQQQPQQQAPNATNSVGATQTVQAIPDQAVTAVTDPSETNTRSEDALRRPDRQVREGAVRSFQDLQIQGLQTRIGFDVDDELVFLEILTPKTENVIGRIPSESLVEYLRSQFERITDPNAATPLSVRDEEI